MSLEPRSLWLDFKTSFIKKNKENKLCEPWLKSMRLSQIKQNQTGFCASLQVPSSLHRCWVQDHLIQDLTDTLSKRLGALCSVEFQISPPNLPLSQTENKRPKLNQKRFPNLFNPEYSFKNFIVGRNNELAHGAAFSVSQNLETPSFNPLFIFGPSGLGKTHLLNAIGQEALLTKPFLNILYLSAERFLNEYISSLQKKEVSSFRKKYRKAYDLVLMDDIQMITKGPRIQEEFFHTLNELFSKKIPVVVCCDKPPSQIAGLEERIQTRFEGGLVVDISYPALETRLAILKYKTERKKIVLPGKTSELIAKKCKRSVRELEGVLNKIKMFSELKDKLPIHKIIENVLKNIEEPDLTVEEIQKQVAEKFGVGLAELKSPSRIKNLVTARHMAVFLIKKHLRRSLSDIGRSFGNRDHTTILNSLKKADKLLVEDPGFKRILEDLHKKIHFYKKEV